MAAMTRREFLNVVKQVLAVTGIAAIAGSVVAYFYPTDLQETPSEPVLVGAESDLPVGASKTIRYGHYPALVLNTPQGLRAYTAVCTHFGCIVKWNAEIGQIACPCHAGYFDPYDGHVISGPPPTALTAFPIYVVDGQIYLGGGA